MRARGSARHDLANDPVRRSLWPKSFLARRPPATHREVLSLTSRRLTLRPIECREDRERRPHLARYPGFLCAHDE